MTKIAIVGTSQVLLEAKEKEVRMMIADLIISKDVELVSGGAAGIDSMAEQIADACGIKKKIFTPTHGRHWECSPGCYGFKARNLDIAKYCDRGYVFVKKSSEYCYHCNVNTHLTSGGCWTGKHMKELGKEVHWIEI